MRSDRPARPCEWCGRITRAVDRDGDPACPTKVGCGRVRNPGLRIRATDIVEVRGERRTVAEWAATFAIQQKSLVFAARRRGLSLGESIERRFDFCDDAARAAKKLAEALEAPPAERRRGRDLSEQARAIAEAAVSLRLTREAVRKRLRRIGSLEQVLALGPKRATGSGRRPTRGLPVDEIAATVGLSRQGLYKAARKAGHSIDDEIAQRLSKKASAA